MLRNRGGKKSGQGSKFGLGPHARKVLQKRLLMIRISESHLQIGDEVAKGVTGIVIRNLEA